MMMKFVLMLVGVPLIALSLVITITILKTGWNIINKKNHLILIQRNPKASMAESDGDPRISQLCVK